MTKQDKLDECAQLEIGALQTNLINYIKGMSGEIDNVGFRLPKRF